MDEALRNLPWQTQVALASGYAAYLIAYVGIRDWHHSIDTAFRALVFSVIASGTLWLTRSWHPLESGTAAVICTCLAGLLWRAVSEPLFGILYRFNHTWSDDTPSAWAKFQANRKNKISQIAVELDDGTWLKCENAGQFSDALYGPATLGTNGDVALYLTDIETPNGESKPVTFVRDANLGDRITYVPASRIRRVTMRLCR